MAERKVDSISCQINYPISRNDLLDQYGECQVYYSNGDVEYLNDLMGDTEIDVFNSYGDLVAIIE